MSGRCCNNSTQLPTGPPGPPGPPGPAGSGGINISLDYLDPVIDYLNDPPVGPSAGDRYLIDTAPTDAWIGHENEIAEWDGATWVYTVPVEDDYVYVTNTLTTYHFTSGAWELYPGTAILQNGNSFGLYGVRIGSNDLAPVYFKTNNVNRGIIDSSGNFGIGTTTPAYKLDIQDNSPEVRITALTGNASLYFGVNGTSTLRGQIYVDSTNQRLNFYTINNSTVFYGGVGLSQVETLRMTREGSVKIGVFDDTYEARLSVIGDFTYSTFQLKVGYDATRYWTGLTDTDGLTTFSSAGPVAGAYGFSFEGTFGVSHINGAIEGTISTNDSGTEFGWTDGVDTGSLLVNNTIAELSHTVAISLDAPALGVFGVTPIAQPTTAYAAATFVANTSLIANDSATFDGYTIGQVVKALRDLGLLT